VKRERRRESRRRERRMRIRGDFNRPVHAFFVILEKSITPYSAAAYVDIPGPG